VAKCVVCHCTDSDCSGCIKKTGEPCWWFGPDLCSACATSCKGASLWMPWAGFIADGRKSIETRVWKTKYRGPLLICSAQTFDSGWRDIASQPDAGLGDYHGAHRRGRALCVANLVNCRPMEKRDEDAAMVRFLNTDNQYSWELADVKPVTPFPIIGKQRLFKVNGSILRKAV